MPWGLSPTTPDRLLENATSAFDTRTSTGVHQTGICDPEGACEVDEAQFCSGVRLPRGHQCLAL
ncbi:hypothetical protein CEP50_02240 [Actinopolyspora mortivallis]|uniref:Uncharacterized protein n=1 Tax=Actinopolyspora mortivallis TaxID=33906 RepID=A0A2T0H1U1_ACTMO|nr:hypothetical protein CEP50_02240 [Actinopolyspora mortivallis]